MVNQPFKRQPHRTAKHSQTISRLLPANCLSVFDHFVGLALKGLITVHQHFTYMSCFRGKAIWSKIKPLMHYFIGKIYHTVEKF